jgi:hypothetical protein
MKIVELYIEEEDNESGVSELSLVAEPATHYSWLVFNSDQCSGSCQIKKDIKNGESLASYIQMGVDFRIEDVEMKNEKFYSPFSTSNRTSSEDNDRELVRYYYAVDTGMGANLIKESRELCRDFIFAGLVYRDEDLTDMSRQLSTISGSRNKIPRTPGVSVDLKNWKMGKQCRHIFRRLIFKVPEGMTKEEFASTLPTSASQSFSLASRNEYQDGVAGISNRAGYIAGLAGFSNDNKPMGYIQGLIVYPTFKSMMDTEPKVLGWSFIEVEGQRGFIAGIPDEDYFEGVDVKVVESGMIEETFYTDYPESAKEAARVAIKRNEELGNPCATQVGKIRAQQIIRGENLSYETIKRTYSYLSRAKEGYEKAKSEGDYNACSYISYGLWGGDSMLNYSERIIRQEEEDFYGNTGCIGTLITEGVGELEAIKKCSRNRRAHITEPYYDPTDDNEYTSFVENAGGFSVGDYVSWTYAGRGEGDDRARGQITDLRIQGEVNVPGTDYSLTATEERPVALIETADGSVVGQYTDNLRQIQKPDNFNYEEYLEDREMVDGIIDLIIEVDDLEERKKVAYEAIETLTGEGVAFDLEDFVQRLGLQGQMVFGRQTFKDDVKYEITTVVMEPDRYIVRKDHYTDELYYVVFTKDTVKMMAQKFFKQSNHKNFNYEHSDLKLNGGYVFESWLVQNPETDKARELGFNVNKGTWMVSLKWDDKEEFEKYVLSQETLGISLEGNFLSREFDKHKQEYSVIGEMDGEPIYSTEDEALKRASVIGCSGTHKHGEGYMACQSHPILQDVKNSTFASEYDIFIEEVKDIINKQ